MSKIPFNRVAFLGNERRYIEEALSNLHVSSDGPFTRRARGLLADALDVPSVLLTTSCTDALEMSGILLDLGPGDEVIMPSFTFVSTANAFVLRGARPVFVDIREDTYNLDERLVDAAITPRTKAIVPVHYAGVGCAMDVIMELAERHRVPVIEDNAHGLFGSFHGRPLGSFGAMSTLSFHETKNLSCGEGGALAIRDPQLISRAEIIHAKGTDRARFLRRAVDRYSWVDVGSSFGLSDLLAAVLLGQLEHREELAIARARLHDRYHQQLTSLAGERGWALQHVPSECASTHHIFSLCATSERERDAVLAFLHARGILALFHYVPLHLSEMGRYYGYAQGQLPVTERVASRLFRLPMYATMRDAEVDEVCDALRAFGRDHPTAAHSSRSKM